MAHLKHISSYIPVNSFILALLLVLLFNTHGYELMAQPSKKSPLTYYKVPMPHKANNNGQTTDWRFHGSLRKKFQIDDILLSKLKYRPPRSIWIESEKAFYQELLKDKAYDILVVPFQTRANGIDHVGRMLMSYRLAVAIEKNTELKVAPLSIVYRALGELSRFYDEDEVRSLAKQLKVRKIIWSYAGTRDTPEKDQIQFSFSLIKETPSPTSKASLTHKQWDYKTLPPELLPHKEFESNLYEIMHFLDLPYKSQHTSSTKDSSAVYNVPETINELLTLPQDNLLIRSYVLQFMAMLAPTEYQKTYLFTRSIINLFPLEEYGDERSLIEARAYLHLYRRPAALYAIADIYNAEASALHEFANANLPEFEQKLGALKPSIKKLLAELELHYLRNKYQQKMSETDKAIYFQTYPQWSYFLEKRLAHYDSWQTQSNVDLKLLLDKHFPLPGFSLNELAPGQIIAGSSNYGFKFETLFQDHLRLLMKNHQESIFDKSNRELSLKFDFLTMVESNGLHNLMKEVYFYAFTQSRPEKGMQILDEFSKAYIDHPYFAYYRFTIMYNLYTKSKPDVKKNMRREITNIALKAMWWNGRQNFVHRAARRYLLLINKSDKNQPSGSPTEKFNNSFIPRRDLCRGIGMDYPFRVNVLHFTDYRPIDILLPWIHVDIQPYIYYYNQKFSLQHWIAPKPTDKLQSLIVLKEIESRFNGHPKKTRFLIGHKKAKKQPSEHKDILRQQIDAGSKDWKLYKDLSTLYLFDEAYDEAKSVLLKHPGLHKDSTPNTVAMSNIANDAGDLFFWVGATEQARFFYQMSSDLDTGSGPCLLSKEKIGLLNLDFTTALKMSGKLAKRYDSAQGYANYMTYLHLFGDHETAWSLFNTLITRYGEDDAIWNSAMIGHRKQGSTHKEINKWLQTINQFADTDKMKSQMARLAALSMMDRDPDSNIPKIVELYDRNVPLNFHLKKGFPQPANHPPLFYTIFAKGYHLIKIGSYQEAHKLLRRVASVHFDNFAGHSAYAALKAGRYKGIEGRSIRKQPRKYTRAYNFTKLLAFAVSDCNAGNHDSAISALKYAYAVRPPTEDNPYYTWYHLIELCEWLYEHSNEKAYIKLALNWSRIYQKIQPMHGWAFAFEAKYAPVREDQIKALAYALYLDPKSNRIAGLDPRLKREAKIWFKTHNPFTTRFNTKDSI